MIIVVQMVSNCVVMVRGEVRVHYALRGLGSPLQTAWSPQAWVYVCSNVWVGPAPVVSVPTRLPIQLFVHLNCAWVAEVRPVSWKRLGAMHLVQGQGWGQPVECSPGRAGLGQEARLE